MKKVVKLFGKVGRVAFDLRQMLFGGVFLFARQRNAPDGFVVEGKVLGGSPIPAAAQPVEVP